MTYKTKAIIFAFAALLVAMPLAANSNAFGAISGGTVTIPGECGLTLPSTITMGKLTKGTMGIETDTITMPTTGNTPGTLEIIAGDWLGAGTLSTGHLILKGVVATNTVAINGVTFTAIAAGATPVSDQFVVGGTDTITATNLATLININGNVKVDASSTGNVVLLKSEAVGSGNAFSLAAGQSTIVTSDSAMSAGEAPGAKYMESTNTRFSFTTNGVAPAVSTYALKTAFDEDNVLFVAIPATNSTKDTKMKFQLDGSGDNILVNKPSGLTQSITFSVTCNI